MAQCGYCHNQSTAGCSMCSPNVGIGQANYGSTYTANVFCTNCGHAGSITVRRGNTIAGKECSNCGCTCLIAQPKVTC